MRYACTTFQIAILKASGTKITEPWPLSQSQHTSHNNLAITYSNSHFRDYLWNECELHWNKLILNIPEDMKQWGWILSAIWVLLDVTYNPCLHKMLTASNHATLYTLFGTYTRNWCMLHQWQHKHGCHIILLIWV